MSKSEKTISGIPAMGYGTWNRSGEEAVKGVTWALEAGCRHIDTAQSYNNEEFCGAAIKQSGIPRDQIFITTKVAPENCGPGQLRPSVETSLHKLGVDQVDLLLLHWPSPQNEYPMPSYMEQFAEAFDAGMARMIGVSNFTIAQINEAAELLGDRTIATNQVKIHVYCQNRPIVDHCRSLGISTTAYSPLARRASIDDPLLAEVGRAHGVTGAQIALAFLLAEGHIVIPSSGKKERITSNFEARKIKLNDDEMPRVRGLERGYRVSDDADWMPRWD